jgi:hypothetical protein
MPIIQRLSLLVVLVAPLMVIAYDVIVLTLYGRDGTITYAVQTLARTWHELPWIVGAVLVYLWLHLFGAIVLERL